MANSRVARPSSSVYNRGNARTRLTIKILIYIMSAFLVGTILSYFIFADKPDTGPLKVGTEISRDQFGEINRKGRFSTWDGKTYTEPTATGTSKVYNIDSAEQFAFLWKAHTSGGTYTANTDNTAVGVKYKGATFNLTTDLDLTASRESINGFNGTLNGNGHTIKVDLKHGPIITNASAVWESGYSTNVQDLVIDATGTWKAGTAVSDTGLELYYGILVDTLVVNSSLCPTSDGEAKSWGGMGMIDGITVTGEATIEVPFYPDVTSSDQFITSETSTDTETLISRVSSMSVGSLIGAAYDSNIGGIYISDGIKINVTSGTHGFDKDNPSVMDGVINYDQYLGLGAFYVGGIIGCELDNCRIEASVWKGTINYNGELSGTVFREGAASIGLLNIDGREVSIGGIVGAGSAQICISQGTINYSGVKTNYDWYGGDYTSIGDITGTKFSDTDTGNTTNWVIGNSNIKIDYNTTTHPRLVTFGTNATSVFNMDRITLGGDSNAATNGVSALSGVTTDANMKLYDTYSSWGQTFFDPQDSYGTSSAFVLASNINYGYPMLRAFADLEETAVEFDPSSAGTVGKGSQLEPFIISTKAQFVAMADYYNNTTKTTAGYYWKISPYESTTGAQITFDLGGGWKPIGYDQAHAFTGHLDGGRVVITGMSITSNYKYVGLFGYVASGATISNLGIAATTGNTYNVTTEYDQASYIGGMVGYLQDGAYISNCFYIGKITGYLNADVTRTVGGLAGYYANTISGSNVTPAITTSYYVADHKIYYKTGTSTNTKVEHMEKIYGTGATGSSSTISGNKDFTQQSTFTPFGFTFGNLALVSGTTDSYAWTADYAGKWHTTAGIYNGYPYLDASDAYSYQVNRTNCTNGTLTGSWKMGTVSEGSLVFTSNKSQSLPLRANINFTYTKDANYDAKLTLTLQKDTSTLLTKPYTLDDNNSVNAQITGFTTGTGVKCLAGELTVTDIVYPRHTLIVSNMSPSLGTVTHVSHKDVSIMETTSGYKYNGRGQVMFTITANDPANTNYYYISKILIGATTVYDANANKTAINNTADSFYTALITSVVTSDGTNNPGIAAGSAKTIDIHVAMPKNTETTVVMIYFGKVGSVNKNVIFNTADGADPWGKQGETLVIAPGSKITNADGKLPEVKNTESGVNKTEKGNFIGWLVDGKLVSSDTTLDWDATEDTTTVAELWSYTYDLTFTNLNTAHSYEILHVNTGLRYTVNGTNISIMTGKCIITNLTTDRSLTITLTANATIDLTSIN